jgi:isocitrate dehydrogenase (NAD+)
MAMQMVMNPYQFDVIVTTNLFGDILIRSCIGTWLGDWVWRRVQISEMSAAIFEAVHGSAPDIAGKKM